MVLKYMHPSIIISFSFFFLFSQFNVAFTSGFVCSIAQTYAEEIQKPNVEQSTEVRWFFQGPIPTSLKEWFSNNLRLGSALASMESEERVDLYLIASQSHGLGVKLRGGKLEIKLSENSKKLTETKSGSTGKAESWRKWTWRYSGKDKEAMVFDQSVIDGFIKRTPSPSRVDVWKKRLERKFLNQRGELEPVALDMFLKSGIKAEVTALKVQGKPWWTIACEVVGHSEEPYSELEAGLRWLLKDYPGPRLILDNSYSYPQWLSSLRVKPTGM